MPAGTEQKWRGHRPFRTERDAGEPHVGLFGGLPSLAEVTHAACRDEVLPRVAASARPRDDVIDIQLPQGGTLPAVLALVRISEHEVAPRESHRRARGPVVTVEVHDSRHSK